MKQETIFPEGWAENLATPLTINGFARTLLEPPLALSPLLSQLDSPTNVRHKSITPVRKELAGGSVWRRFLGDCQNEFFTELYVACQHDCLPSCYRTVGPLWD
ncbi:opalin isoform X5 [Rhinolophus sinicus]|uniref:opalin isoform X5 n=1 Tax=Rhinolophus sinicus TaxID=89399 RepID=UPI003D7AD3E2